MRKKLSPKFWSQGTYLGSIGQGSWDPVNEIFSKHFFLFIWGLLSYFLIGAVLVGAKILDRLPYWCVLKIVLNKLVSHFLTILFSFPCSIRPEESVFLRQFNFWVILIIRKMRLIQSSILYYNISIVFNGFLKQIV